MLFLCIAENSLETSLIFCEKQWKNIYEWSSATVLIGTLRVNGASWWYRYEDGKDMTRQRHFGFLCPSGWLTYENLIQFMEIHDWILKFFQLDKIPIFKWVRE